MTNLENYMNDGANAQAQAVLCALKCLIGGGIEESWDSERGRYLAEVKVARWENCREQGYVVMLTAEDYSKQLNIAFFEHRNSDSIHAVKWQQITTNSPTIENMDCPEYLKNKFDTSYCVDFGCFLEIARWIKNQLVSFWEDTKKLSPKKGVRYNEG